MVLLLKPNQNHLNWIDAKSIPVNRMWLVILYVLEKKIVSGVYI